MIKIIIDNSESQVLGLNAEELKSLRALMTYSIGAQASYFSKSFRSPQRHLMDSKGRFPTGLLYILYGYLHDNYPMQVEVKDLRTQPNAQEGLFKLSLPYEPYPEQREAAEAAGEASRGIIVAPTGAGKSVIISLLINELQVPTLVVVPSLELKRQLSESLSSHFGEKQVGKGKPIWVENIDALDIKKVYAEYPAVIIDEFHHSGAKTYRTLNKKALTRTYYRFGLTATPFRSQEEERLLLESVLSEVVYTIEYKDAVLNKRIVPIEAYYYELPKTPLTGTTWAQVYSQLVVNNQIRNDLITSLLLSLNRATRSTLCLVKTIQHGETLSNGGAFPLVTGQNDERHLIESFSKGQIPVLVSTTGIMGEGIDSRACEYVIIAGLGKSKNAFHQQIGRAFRNFPGKDTGKIILFRDRSHKFTERHFKLQLKYLREDFGIDAVKLEYET